MRPDDLYPKLFRIIISRQEKARLAITGNVFPCFDAAIQEFAEAAFFEMQDLLFNNFIQLLLVGIPGHHIVLDLFGLVWASLFFTIEVTEFHSF